MATLEGRREGRLPQLLRQQPSLWLFPRFMPLGSRVPKCDFPLDVGTVMSEQSCADGVRAPHVGWWCPAFLSESALVYEQPLREEPKGPSSIYFPDYAQTLLSVLKKTIRV